MTTTVERGEWSASCPGHSLLYPREILGTHCTGGWVGPRAGLDRCGKSRPHRVSIPRKSSQLLYRLYYTVQNTLQNETYIWERVVI